MPSALTNVRFWHKADIPIGKTADIPIGKAIAASAAIGSKLIGCLKNLPISLRSRFRNRILDLNQIKSPPAQTIVQGHSDTSANEPQRWLAFVEQGVMRRYESGDRRAGDGGFGLWVFK